MPPRSRSSFLCFTSPSSVLRNARASVLVALASSQCAFPSLLSRFFFPSPFFLYLFSLSRVASPYHYLSVIWASSSCSRRNGSLPPVLHQGPDSPRLGPRSSPPPSHQPNALAFPPRHSSARDPSTFGSPRASRRRLVEIFSLLPSRNEQCGGSGMQDGRCTLGPRATRRTSFMGTRET